MKFRFGLEKRPNQKKGTWVLRREEGMSELKGQSIDRGRGEEFKCRGEKVIYIMRPETF